MADYVATLKDIPGSHHAGGNRSRSIGGGQGRSGDLPSISTEDNRAVPAPSKAKRGQPVVELPVSLSAKILLLNEMIRQHVRPANWRGDLKTTPQEVNRLTDVQHTTRIDAHRRRPESAGQAAGYACSLIPGSVPRRSRA